MSSVDMPVIAQALGHTNIKTTQIYVEDIGNDKQNWANKKLLNEVLEEHSSVQDAIIDNQLKAKDNHSISREKE